MAPAKKRRSLEGVLNESKAKAWYDQEAAKSSVSITKQQRRKSGLAKLGGFLKKYTSSSKMEKLHHSSDRVSLRSSDHSTSMSEHSHISEDSLTQRAKQNLPLRRLVEQGKLIPMESDEPMLTDTSKESLMQLGSEPGSFGSGDYTPLRELNESAISLPSTPSGKQTTVVQRSHSALSSMLSEPPPSPSSWFRRKSLRLRQRQMGSDVLKEEPELEAAESESMSGSSGLGSSEAVTPVAASTSIVAAVVTEDRRQRGLRRLPMVEPSAIPLVSEDEMTPVSALQHHDMTTLRSLSKRTPSSTSSTTLSRLGAFLLHRGPSSASRASQNTSMITPAGAIQRRKSKKETNSRRRSDTSTCSTTGSILEVSLTPRGINETLTRRCVPAEAEYNFQQVVRVLPTRAVDELSSQSYDAIAIDVFVNGDPASSFSRHVLHHVDVGSSLRDDILMEPNFRVGVRNVGSDKVTFTKKLLFVVVKRTGSEEEARRQLRFGYDAVLQKAFREESIRSLLLPQLFANALQGEGEGSVPESLTDSTLRTVYLDVVKNMNWKKISSIALAGLTAENTALLQRSFENILEEKKSLVGRSSSFNK